jgi:hypothetical protein
MGYSNDIYSNDINKICAVCRHAKPVTGSEDHIECEVQKKYMPKDGMCDDFLYDIFKKPTRRKRRLKKGYSADQFKL